MSLTITLSNFVKDLKSKNRSKFTVTAYYKDLEQLASYLSKLGINTWEKANTQILEKYIFGLKNEKDLSLKSISRKINSMRTFYKYLIAHKLIKENYALQIKHPKVQRQIPRVLSPLEYKALRDTARSNIRLYTMIEMLLQSGMRIGELSRLKKTDLNKDLTRINIESYSSYPQRSVEINSALKSALTNYFIHKSVKTSDSKYVFFTRSGGKVLIRNIRSSIDGAFKATGIKDAKVNDLRNTFIIHQLESGMRVDKLAQTVGHKRQSTTEYYLEFIESRPQKTTSTIKSL